MDKRGEEQFIYYLGRLSQALNLGDLLGFYQELKGRSPLILELEEAVKDEDYFSTKHFPDIFELRLFRMVNYFLVRAIKPTVMIETGVMHGLTSQFLLHAIKRNKMGRLISIDLPSYHEKGPASKDGCLETLPPNREPGWVVGREYQPHWDLVLGNSLVELPKLLKNHRQVDIFLHDSDHTYATMWSEVNLAWPRIRPGGFLICDNIDFCTAFFDFCRKVNIPPVVCPHFGDNANSPIRFGIVAKPL